jgi:hypothetical protein
MLALLAVAGALAAAALDPFGADAESAASAAVPGWSALSARRAELRDELSGAVTPQEQAAAARQLAAAYERAAAAAGRGPLAASERAAATAYSALADAADGGDETAFTTARDRVTEAEASLERAARRLRRNSRRNSPE